LLDAAFPSASMALLIDRMTHYEGQRLIDTIDRLEPPTCASGRRVTRCR
jgi:hypothetical protein